MTKGNILPPLTNTRLAPFAIFIVYFFLIFTLNVTPLSRGICVGIVSGFAVVLGRTLTLSFTTTLPLRLRGFVAAFFLERIGFGIVL
jgi:hypothetical protein